MNRYVINHEGSTTASDEYNEAMIIVIYLQVFVKKKNTYVSYILWTQSADWIVISLSQSHIGFYRDVKTLMMTGFFHRTVWQDAV